MIQRSILPKIFLLVSLAATFIGALMDDADSALSREFSPDQSPLRTPDGDPIDTIERWMRFAAVLD